jgi:hypothetical protein
LEMRIFLVFIIFIITFSAYAQQNCTEIVEDWIETP